MDKRWKTYATMRVPRYTSYPTAADFSPNVGSQKVESWISGLADGEPLSVYIHVPFCQKLCWYCGCATSVPNRYEKVSTFVETLVAEIKLWAARLGDHGGVRHLHFGGGSPNALSLGDFERLLNAVDAAFGLRNDRQISIELDPRTLSDDFIETLGRLNVNRASLGVQTLDRKTQLAVGRVQPRAMISRSVAHLRRAGVRNINMDLMYGLPHQTVETVTEAADYAADVGADRVAVFGYAHVPWFAKHQRAINEADLPGLEARFEQAEAADAVFRSAGYRVIGLDHYAKPDDSLSIAADSGTLRRTFQGYTDDDCATLIGIGPTSVSMFEEGFAQSCKQQPAWRESVEAGLLPIERGIELTQDDRMRAWAIENLMCDLFVDTALVCKSFDQPADALDDALRRAEALVADGLCRVEGRRIFIPEEARVMMRAVAACFDARRADTPTQHAIAV